MQEFFDAIGLLFKGFGVALNLPFQIYGVTITVASIMPAFLGIVVTIVCCVGITKLIMGWI